MDRSSRTITRGAELLAASAAEVGARELARRLGVSHSSLGRISRGEVSPSLRMVAVLSDVVPPTSWWEPAEGGAQ